MSEQITAQEEEFDATAEFRSRLKSFTRYQADDLAIDRLAIFSIAESLDCISNDLAAIANMMADEAQEREAEQNRQEWVRPGASDRTP